MYFSETSPVVTSDVVDITFFPATSTALMTLSAQAKMIEQQHQQQLQSIINLKGHTMASYTSQGIMKKFEFENNSPNPSKVARTTSPGRRLKNFFPTLELAIEFVMNPVTLTTPERILVVAFLDMFVIFLTLHRYITNTRSQRLYSTLH